MRDVVIVSGARTAIGSFGGTLKTVSAIDLGALVIHDALDRAKLRPVISAEMSDFTPDTQKGAGKIDLEKNGHDFDCNNIPVTIDETIMGNVLQAGLGQNPSRQSAVYGGVPKETPACTVNKVCGSGLKAIAIAAQSIASGNADVVVAGGMENMSMVPMALKNGRWGYRMEVTGVGAVHDLMVYDGLYEIFYGYHMGITAENIAKLYGISREEQDNLGCQSHTRARNAITSGLFRDEIVPVVIKNRKGDVIFDTDERPMDTTFEQMSAMRPAFAKDGTVTAGNASGINDGAAAVVVMSADKAKELGLAPWVKIKGFASGGLDPAFMGLGPVPSIRKVMKQTGMSVGDFGIIELNEAFASQAIGCFRELDIRSDFPNQHGSGISLGHPIGCTGARMVVSTMYAMRRSNRETALISMCIGGGMGMAMVIENCS